MSLEMAQRYVAFHTGVEGWLNLNGAAKTPLVQPKF